MDSGLAALPAVPRHEIITASSPAASDADGLRRPPPGPVAAVERASSRGENVRVFACFPWCQDPTVSKFVSSLISNASLRHLFWIYTVYCQILLLFRRRKPAVLPSALHVVRPLLAACMYTRNQLFTFCSFAPPTRPVRKALFSHKLWLPRTSRLRWRRVHERWRSTPIPTPPLRSTEARPIPSAVKQPKLNSNFISFGLLNAQSVGNKFGTIKTTITEADYDVLLLTETWHTASGDVALRRCIPDGYTCLDVPRPLTSKSKVGATNHGGVAAIISNKLTCKKIRLPTQPSTFEYLCFSITGSATTVITLLIYRPGSKPPTDAFFADLSTALETVALYKCQIIVAGDFNVRVNLPSDRDAVKLSDILDSFDCTQHVPHVPTHIDGGTLDLIITKSDECPQGVSVDPPNVISDHSLVSWQLHLLHQPPISINREVRCWKKVDKAALRAALLDSDLCKPDHQCTTADEYFATYNTALQSLADKFAPTKKVTTRRQKLAAWMDDECRLLRCHSRRLERRFRKSRILSDRRAWVEHERKRHCVYLQKETAFWNQQLIDNAKQPQRLWRTMQSVIGTGRLRQQKNPVLSADDLLRFFNEKVDGVRRSTGNVPVQSSLPPAEAELLEFELCTQDEVMKVISSGQSKYCSLDPVPTDILKELLPDIIPFVTNMCNASMQQGTLPISQRHALVTPRLKKTDADPSDAMNYRPISNLSFMSKVVERLVCRQLVSFLEKHGLLPSLQSAYRRGHSTETAVLKIICDILLATDHAEVTLLGLLDLSAAFDTVDHEILLARLSTSFGIRSSALSWIKSFLLSRTQTVLFAGQRSKCSPVSCGVPQGSVLGPILFLLYTVDVIEIARHHGLGVHSYADDTQLYLHTPATSLAEQSVKITTCISEINVWMASNRLKLNTNKTQFMCAGTRQQLSKVSANSILLDGASIELSDEVMLLGVVVDCELTFAPYIKRLAARCFYQLRQLRTIRRTLTISAAKTLVHAVIISRLDYCNSVLIGVADVHLKRLQLVLNAAARLVIRKRKFDHITATLRDDLHWLPIVERIDFKTCFFVYKCLHQLAPDYLSQLCVPLSTIVGRQVLRSAARGDLDIPRTNTKTYGPRSFAVAGPTVWNNLHPDVRNRQLTTDQFRSALKTAMFRRAYPHVRASS